MCTIKGCGNGENITFNINKKYDEGVNKFKGVFKKYSLEFFIFYFLISNLHNVIIISNIQRENNK